MTRIALVLALAVAVPASGIAATSTTTSATHTSTSKSRSSKTTPSVASTTHATTTAPNRTDASDDARGSYPHFGMRSWGFGVGMVSPENYDGTYLLGVSADCGRLAPRIAFEPHLDFWSKSQDAFGASASVRDVILGVHGKYLFEVSNPKIQPFAGAGLGIHMLHAEATIPANGGFPATKVEDSTTKLGIDFGGGASLPIGPRSDLTGEVWYGIVSDVSQLSVRVGMSYRIGS